MRYIVTLLVLLILSAHCVKETQHAVVVVSTTGLDPDVSAMQAAVTVAGVSASEVQQLTREQSVFSLQLPAGSSGDVRVDIAAQSGAGCLLATGQGDVQVSGIGRYDLTVPLTRLGAPDCRSTVVLNLSGISAEIRRLAVSAVLDSSVLLSHQDYPGSTRQITLALGDSVRGALSVVVDGFGCRSCLISQGQAALNLLTFGRHELGVKLSMRPQAQCPPPFGRLKTARYGHTATLLDVGPYAGQVVISAGDDTHNNILGSAERYDPRTGITTPAGDLKTTRFSHTTTQLATGPDRGRLLIAGGYNGQWLKSVEILDLDTGISRPAASLSVARNFQTATRLADGRVVLIGGHSDQGAFRIVEIYDPVTGQWSLADDAPATEYQQTATQLLDGRIVVAGGRLQNSAVVAGSAIFDPSASRGMQWARTNDLTTERSAHSTSLLPGGQVLIAGGYGQSSETLGSAEIFEPGTRLWRLAGPLKQARGAHGAVVLSNGQVFMSGGADAALSQIRADGELYEPSKGGTAPVIPLSIARATHPAILLPDDGVLLAGGLTLSGGTVTSTDSIELVFPLGCTP